MSHLRGKRARVGPSASSSAAKDRAEAEVRGDEHTLLLCRRGGSAARASASVVGGSEAEYGRALGALLAWPVIDEGSSELAEPAGALTSISSLSFSVIGAGLVRAKLDAAVWGRRWRDLGCRCWRQ